MPTLRVERFIVALPPLQTRAATPWQSGTLPYLEGVYDEQSGRGTTTGVAWARGAARSDCEKSATSRAGAWTSHGGRGRGEIRHQLPAPARARHRHRRCPVRRDRRRWIPVLGRRQALRIDG